MSDPSNQPSLVEVNCTSELGVKRDFEFLHGALALIRVGRLSLEFIIEECEILLKPLEGTTMGHVDEGFADPVTTGGLQ